MRFVREVAVSVVAGICLFIIIPVLKAWDWHLFYHNINNSYPLPPPYWALLLFFIGQPVATWDHYRKNRQAVATNYLNLQPSLWGLAG